MAEYALARCQRNRSAGDLLCHRPRRAELASVNPGLDVQHSTGLPDGVQWLEPGLKIMNF